MIKDYYRTEMNKDVYAESNGRRGLEEHSIGTYSDDYVKWLESKVKNLTIPVVIKPKGTVCRCFNNICGGWSKNNTCKSNSFNCKGRQTDL